MDLWSVWFCSTSHSGFLAQEVFALIWSIHRDSPSPSQELWRGELDSDSCCSYIGCDFAWFWGRHGQILQGCWVPSVQSCISFSLTYREISLFALLHSETGVLFHTSLLLLSLAPPPFLRFFFVLSFLSLFLSNSYLFSNLPQEISTLIGSQQNKKERKTQYLKDEYLGENISLLMSWFQSGLFAIYMSIITIHLRTVVLLLKRRFLTALQTLWISFTCRAEGNDGIPSAQRGSLAQSGSRI